MLAGRPWFPFPKSLRTAARASPTVSDSRPARLNIGSQAASKKRTKGPPLEWELVRVMPPSSSQMNNSCSSNQARVLSVGRPVRRQDAAHASAMA